MVKEEEEEEESCLRAIYLALYANVNRCLLLLNRSISNRSARSISNRSFSRSLLTPESCLREQIHLAVNDGGLTIIR